MLTDVLEQAEVDATVALPAPRRQGTISVEEAISRRRSCQAYQRRPLSLEQIGQLCWAAQGVTSSDGLRAAPSAGASYPLELYLVCREGLFHYRPDGHGLEKRSAQDARRELAQAALKQEFIAEAPVVLVITAVYERTTRRYRDRGIRYVHMDVGLAVENLHLQAEALGLGSVSIGAFEDDRIAEILHLPSTERPLYLVPVGYARK